MLIYNYCCANFSLMQMSNHSFRLSTVVALCGILFCAASQTAAAYDNAKIGEKSFSFQTCWVAQDVFDFTRSGNMTDFFVADGIVFVNDVNGEDNRFKMERFSVDDGMSLGPVDVQWDVEGTPQGSTFVGCDSDGKPFVASRGAARLQDSGYPFVIFPLEIVDGVPHAIDRYVLPLETPWWPRDPFVMGTFGSGRFTVVAAAWSDSTPTDKGFIVKWEVNGSKTGTIAAKAECKVSECITMPLDEEHILIYDRNRYYTTTGYDFNEPQICRFNETGTGITVTDKFDGTVADASYGFATAVVDNEIFAMYSDSLLPYSYKVMHLPSYPQTFANHTHLWNLSEIHTSEQNPIESYLDRKKGTVVHSSKIDNNATDFYVLTDGKGLAKYKLQSTSGSQVMVEELEIEQVFKPRYYSLTGIAVTHPVPGEIYISLNSAGQAKVVKY